MWWQIRLNISRLQIRLDQNKGCVNSFICILRPSLFACNALTLSCCLIPPQWTPALYDRAAAGGPPKPSGARRLSPSSAAHRSRTEWPYSPLISRTLTGFCCLFLIYVFLIDASMSLTVEQTLSAGSNGFCCTDLCYQYIRSLWKGSENFLQRLWILQGHCIQVDCLLIVSCHHRDWNACDNNKHVGQSRDTDVKGLWLINST